MQNRLIACLMVQSSALKMPEGNLQIMAQRSDDTCRHQIEPCDETHAAVKQCGMGTAGQSAIYRSGLQLGLDQPLLLVACARALRRGAQAAVRDRKVGLAEGAGAGRARYGLHLGQDAITLGARRTFLFRASDDITIGCASFQSLQSRA